MKEIKFTTHCEPVLSFLDKEFKTKYEERIGNNTGYVQKINGDVKHLAVCPRCNNPVTILGIYKKIDTAPHARHAKGINIPYVTQYNEYRYLNCPYHRKHADYVKEYVPETEEKERQELYRIAREHFDKAIYLLQKKTGIRITHKMAEELAENYARMRAYNYIDATMYNIPWYLLYSHHGFPIYHMLVRKDTVLYRNLKRLGMELRNSRLKEYVYVEEKDGSILIATNYRYVVNAEDELHEWLDFSVVRPVDSSYFGNLVYYKDWNKRQDLLDIAGKYMDS